MDPFSRRRPKASKGSAEESKSKLDTIILAHCHSVLVSLVKLAQKISKFHAGVKKCHFGKFLEWAGMAVPC